MAFNTVNAKAILMEKVASKSPPLETVFDIFLSYRADDIDVVMGVYEDLIRRRYTVYLDRIMDPQLDREKVTKDTADILRKRLIQSKSLFYASTENSSGSKWMPWELGFEDGYRGKAAIVPITDQSVFVGIEFVAMYPKIEPDAAGLWVFEADSQTLISRYEIWRDAIPKRKCGMPTCPIPK